MKTYNFETKSSISINIFIISKLDLFKLPNFIKIGYVEILRPILPQVFNFSQDSQSQTSYLWLTNSTCFYCHKFGSILLLGTKLSGNEEIDTCFNVKCVLRRHNFDFLGGYLVVTAHYLVVTTRYWWLLLVTAHSHIWYERTKSRSGVFMVKFEHFFEQFFYS